MPDDKVTPSDREKLLEQLVMGLGHKLAISLAYLAAIDDVIDPFRDIDVDKAWIIATLTANARTQLFKDAEHHQPWGADTHEVILAARKQKKIDITETDLFSACRHAVGGVIRKHGESLATP